ncbi:hypothetical membrane protein [Pseudomonas veronii 1YdBTEX2]|uniref:Hypothetical membrane protein n=1 Tax=Pseudomonas veronii 1YdBTEX2 TaxID=1295141 RepID=A0A1D3JSC8_PSEVE|nr:hypothetical protein [Pseudomonas veronii]SBW78996.1 hypothetical membrane protein [Pseudomonas veronii 1YdBTEX2]
MNETLSNYEFVKCIASLLGFIGFIIMFKIIVLKEEKSRKAEFAEFCLMLILWLCPMTVELYFNDPCKIDAFNDDEKAYECLDYELIQVIHENMKHRSGAR